MVMGDWRVTARKLGQIFSHPAQSWAYVGGMRCRSIQITFFLPLPIPSEVGVDAESSHLQHISITQYLKQRHDLLDTYYGLKMWPLSNPSNLLSADPPLQLSVTLKTCLWLIPQDNLFVCLVFTKKNCFRSSDWSPPPYRINSNCSTYQLHATDEGQGASATTAPHDVLLPLCGGPRGAKARESSQIPPVTIRQLPPFPDFFFFFGMGGGSSVWPAAQVGAASKRAVQPLCSGGLVGIKAVCFVQTEGLLKPPLDFQGTKDGGGGGETTNDSAGGMHFSWQLEESPRDK